MNETTAMLSQYQTILDNINLPLSILHTYVQLLDSIELTPDARELIAATQRASNNILDLVSQEHEVVVTESLNITRLDIAHTLYELVDKTRLLSSKKKVTIRYSSNVDHIFFKTDRLILERVFLTLLSSVIQMSIPSSTIFVHLQANENNLLVSVTNNCGFSFIESSLLCVATIRDTLLPLNGTLTEGDTFVIQLPHRTAIDPDNIISLSDILNPDDQMTLW